MPNLNSIMEPVRRRACKLEAKREVLISRKVTLKLEEEENQEWLTLKPQVLAVFENMQREVQNKTIDQYEALLTTAMRSVLPESIGRVMLDMRMERGRPALDFNINANGDVESIHEDRGGALANIISTALRYVVLNKMPSRRFIALDEPDCWIKPARIQAYFAMLSNLSFGSNIQTLLISHHNVDTIQNARIIQLSRDPKKGIVSEVMNQGLSDSEAMSQDEQWAHVDRSDLDGIGIRYIRMINVKSHSNTLIELSPYLNAIIGDNDIGKSVLISALKAVMYNVSTDSIIRHHQPEARIEIGLEDGMTLIWTRKRKGKTINGVHQKVSYELLDDSGTQIAEAWTAKKVPSFVQDVMGVQLLDNNIDPHIGHQKAPVFIVGPDTTPSVRASLLSVGEEMQHIRNMLNSFNEEISTRQARNRAIKKELTSLENLISKLTELNPALDRLEQQDAKRQTLDKQGELIQQIEQLNSRFHQAKQAQSLFAHLNEMKTPVENKALSKDYEQETDLFFRWMKASRVQKVFQQAEFDISNHTMKTPEINYRDMMEQSELFLRWHKHLRLGKIFNQLPETKPVPQLETGQELDQMFSALVSLDKVQREKLAITQGLKENEASQKDNTQELAAAVEELGGVCPTCEGPLHAKYTHQSA